MAYNPFVSCEICNNLVIKGRSHCISHIHKEWVCCDKEICKNKLFEALGKIEIRENSHLVLFANGNYNRKDYNFSIFKKNKMKVKASIIHRYIKFNENNPKIYIQFVEGGYFFVKKISYSKLAKLNFHLPIIQIKPIGNPTLSIIRKNKKLFNFCLITNQCLKYCILSNVTRKSRCNGMFSFIPSEILYIIIKFYIELI
jgi:hypothetical protein